MKDQYDDGRYDGPLYESINERTNRMADQYDDGRYYPDGILAPPAFGPTVPPAEVRNVVVYSDEHGFAETSIGYAPITAPRGGIKYPTPTKLKGTTMAQSTQQKLAALKNKAENLAAEIANLERAVKKAERPEPSPGDYKWQISVKFRQGGSVYTYLVLRHGDRYYTTGTNQSDRVFASWDEFLTWLDSAYSHSKLLPLVVDYDQTPALDGRTGR